MNFFNFFAVSLIPAALQYNRLCGKFSTAGSFFLKGKPVKISCSFFECSKSFLLIAAAGKAAHLGGVVAAYTPLPVIAVPMKTSDLGGLDSLLSMVQMPSGVPVACVAINGAKNAAILALQMLGTGNDAYRARMGEYKQEMAQA